MEMYEKTSENLNKNIFILLSKISWGQQWWRKMKYCSLSLKWAFRGHILEENLISEEDISEEDISEEDILRRIFWGGYSEEDILRRTFWGGHSEEDILRRTFWEGHSEEDILRRTFQWRIFMNWRRKIQNLCTVVLILVQNFSFLR